MVKTTIVVDLGRWTNITIKITQFVNEQNKQYN